MATETIPSRRASLRKWLNFFELERTFFIFAVIYFPVAWLFLDRGPLEETLLALYTVIMAAIALAMLGKFAFYLAREANEHTGKYGTLWLVYLVDGLFPLVMLKFFGFIFMMAIPLDRHQGLVCDLVRLISYVYWQVLQYQMALFYLIWGSLVLMFVATLWNVRK